jgi:hypothetical protein
MNIAIVTELGEPGRAACRAFSCELTSSCPQSQNPQIAERLSDWGNTTRRGPIFTEQSQQMKSFFD